MNEKHLGNLDSLHVHRIRADLVRASLHRIKELETLNAELLAACKAMRCANSPAQWAAADELADFVIAKAEARK